MTRIASLRKAPTKTSVVKAGNVCRIKQRVKLNEKGHCFHELHYLGSLQRGPFGKRDRYGLQRNRASPDWDRGGHGVGRPRANGYQLRSGQGADGSARAAARRYSGSATRNYSPEWQKCSPLQQRSEEHTSELQSLIRTSYSVT